MSPAWWGGFLGAVAACGLLLTLSRLAAMRRPSLALRVLPYIRDVPRPRMRAHPAVGSVSSPMGVAAQIFGPSVRSAAELVERILGGTASVRRRLLRAGLDDDVHRFRVEQVFWGLAGFAGIAAIQVVRTLSGPVDPGLAALTCLAGLAGGVMWRDNRLSAAVARRERLMVVEFPTIAEMLALAVAAGEGPTGALDRVVRRSRGELSKDLGRVLAGIRTGDSVAEGFDRLAATTGLPLVARFARGIAVSVERGTPLADVLHAQAADVREAGRRALIESAARREVAMMAPVVFLILPVTILFAFFPAAVGLSLMAR